ncbi:hypothetical protein GCM10007973_05650 [Polymorphobacter multimanifer]|nr:hypothetical protein GCM10007973_05650 [Polymorphobacter multimanifer]
MAFRALTAGDIDLYVDYSGTLWSNALGRTDVAPRASMIGTLRTELHRRNKEHVAAVLGLENAYALAMQSTDDERLGIASLADRARQSDRLRLATDTEFQSREECAALPRASGLRFARLTAYTPTLMVRALIGGEADVMTAFSSDGRIAADDLTLLTDPAGALPSYDAMLLIGPTRPDLARRLQALEGRIAVEAMRQANWQVDRATDKRTPEQAARWLAGRIAEK